MVGYAACVALVGLTACSSTRDDVDPRYSRFGGTSRPATMLTDDTDSSATDSASAVTAVRPEGRSADAPADASYYTVKRGDSLHSIARELGYSVKDLVRWNSLADPDRLEVGQRLRVSPSGDDAQTAAARPRAVESRPLTPSTAVTGSGAMSVTESPDTSADSSALAAVTRWVWPSGGQVITHFGERSSKGLDIAGRPGDPVQAAADGRVVYAGNSLRGYGNLVIVKHAGNFLSVYAHNQTLVVREDQTVRRGQKIAEMGATDADRVKLHFEVRREGKPIDPLKVLPPR